MGGRQEETEEGRRGRLGGLWYALTHPLQDFRLARRILEGRVRDLRAAAAGLRELDRHLISEGTERRATELWGIPPAERGRYLRLFLLEAAGLALVAAISFWSAAGFLAAGGGGIATGIAALFFAVVVLGRALFAWWRIDCLRADRIVGFARWLRNGLELGD